MQWPTYRWECHWEDNNITDRCVNHCLCHIMKCPYIQSHIISAILRLRWWDAGSFLFNCCSCCCRLWYWHSFEQKQYCFSFTVSSKCGAVLSPATQLMMQRQRWCLNKMTLTYIVTNIITVTVRNSLSILQSPSITVSNQSSCTCNMMLYFHCTESLVNVSFYLFQSMIGQIIFFISIFTMQSAPEDKLAEQKEDGGNNL